VYNAFLIVISGIYLFACILLARLFDSLGLIFADSLSTVLLFLQLFVILLIILFI